jgi:hypothetical protein
MTMREKELVSGRMGQAQSRPCDGAGGRDVRWNDASKPQECLVASSTTHRFLHLIRVRTPLEALLVYL